MRLEVIFIMLFMRFDMMVIDLESIVVVSLVVSKIYRLEWFYEMYLYVNGLKWGGRFIYKIWYVKYMLIYKIFFYGVKWMRG